MQLDPEKQRPAGGPVSGEAVQVDDLPAQNITAPLRYSRGFGKFSNTPKQHEAADWQAFVAAVLADRAIVKGSQWIASPFREAPDDAEHAGKASTRKAIGKPHRCKACALPRRFIGLDVDHGMTPESFAHLRDQLTPFAALVYETASSTPEAPRCRVLVELDMDAPRAELIEASRVFRARIDAAMQAAGHTAPAWDAACDRPEQPLYLPPVGGAHWQGHGMPACLAELLADTAQVANAATAAQEARHGPPVAPAPQRPDSWALAALASAEAAIRTAPAGSRNDVVNREAFAVGGLVAAGRIAESVALNVLQGAAAWGDDGTPAKTRATLRDGFAQGMTKPRHENMPQQPQQPQQAAGAAPTGQRHESTESKAHDPCTHLANAHRIVQHFGDRLLYVEGIGWHTWSPPWRADELGARRIAHELGRIIANEAAAMAPWVAAAADKAERAERQAAMDRRFKWAGHSESSPVIEHSLRMASPLLSCRADELDASPLLLGLPSGVLELETGQHREHRHSDRLTKVTGCDFTADASAPTWERFVTEAMGGDADLVAFVQCLAGYALSGERSEHLLPILWGSGANGKSTFLGALQAMLGDYASSAAPGLLIQRHGSEHPTGLADLQGRRLVIVSETGEAGRLNEDQAKLLTGGDAITARRMRQDFYTFKPSHLLMLQTNHRPRVAGTDEGIWRRLRLIPFAVTVDPDRRDPALPAKLRAELPGILAWCWRGWQRYRAHGFTVPEAVRAATATYRDASDQVGSFLSERTEEGLYFTATSADLYRSYCQWCDEAGERARSQREFGMRLGERGFSQSRHAQARRWVGLKLIDAGFSSVGSDGRRANPGSPDRAIASHRDQPEKSVIASLPSCPAGPPAWALKGAA